MSETYDKWGEWLYWRAIHLGYSTNTVLSKTIGVSTRQVVRWFDMDEPPKLREVSVKGLCEVLEVPRQVLISTWRSTPIDEDFGEAVASSAGLGIWRRDRDRIIDKDGKKVVDAMKEVIYEFVQDLNYWQASEMYEIVCWFREYLRNADRSTSFKMFLWNMLEKEWNSRKSFAARQAQAPHVTEMDETDEDEQK